MPTLSTTPPRRPHRNNQVAFWDPRCGCFYVGKDYRRCTEHQETYDRQFALYLARHKQAMRAVTG